MSELPADFTHLHVHSHFSLLGATPSVTELVDRARADGLRRLALTDTNALFGAVAFARACRAAGIEPLTGLTVTVSLPAEDMAPDRHAPWGHLVLLAADATGYRSLCRLSSILQADPDPERQRRGGLRWDELKANTDGLICLTGGRTGWLERFLRAGQGQAARRYVSRLGGLFGERCRLAVSADLVAGDERPLADEIVALGRRFGLQPVAAQPVYCLTAYDRDLLRLLAAMAANRPLAEVDGETPADFGDETTTVHWLAPEVVAARFAGQPGLLDAAADVARACGDVLPSGRLLWPSLPGREGTPDEALRAAAEAGVRERFGQAPDPAICARLDRELAAITAFGYAPLFLIVADLVRYARQQAIPVSTRGSVANSLVAFCLGITTVDPIAHDLLFERFLNPARRSPPDIDLDFCSRRRDEVLDYVRRTYGPDRVALVSTMNTLQPRSAVRETSKAHGLPDEVIGALVERLPRHWHPDPRRRRQEDIEAVVAALEDPAHRAAVRQAWRLVGQPHHAGLHPGGLVITPGALTDTLPILLSAKGYLATQYEHADVEAIGLPKLDLLGIRALTVLADAVELVREHQSPGFRLEDIPAGDPATAVMLATGETVGVFQCESDGARRTLRQLRARSVADLAVASAFFKPGPATGGMAKAFVRRYRGEESVAFLHPALEPILGPTKGVLLFQEQVLRVATEIAGLDWGQADSLRRGMSKFRADEMEALAAAFVAGCCRPAPDGPGFGREQADQLWEQVIAFAGYGFNQGHATAYADVSYRSAYLKAHWPAEFLCARLADAGGFHHPAIYMAEAARLGVPVRPPHVNHSGRRFTLTYEADAGELLPVLWMGLGQVRDLRQASVEGIVAARADRPFDDVRDLLARVPLQAKEAANLIQCGALDGLKPSRAAMLAEAGVVSQAGSTQQMSFGFMEAPAAHVPETAAQRVAWETELLGLPVSTHPLALTGRPRGAKRLRQLPGQVGRSVTTCAVRLPGWPGGSGVFIGDGETYAIVRMDKELAADRSIWRPWRPLLLSGRWRRDEWDGGWFQVEAVEPLATVD